MVIKLPEYLVVALAATAVSFLAKPLGELWKKFLNPKKSASMAEAKQHPQSATVELRLKQADGTYKTAAAGQLNVDEVRAIIAEIGDH